MVPYGLHVLSWLALALGLGCAALVTVDVIKRPQHMAVMNIVWPVTALFGTVLVVWLYLRYGRLTTHAAMKQANRKGAQAKARNNTPFPLMVAKATLHCGSGCCLGDICAEWLAYVVPTVALWFGWHTLFAEKIFAVWVVDFLLAFLLGIAFQYFTIAPMRHLGVRQGLWQALKADALSLTAWQVGMYGFMAFAKFWLFGRLLGAPLTVASPEFWLMMQLAMLCGFLTSFPVNWWLLTSGVKEKM